MEKHPGKKKTTTTGGEDRPPLAFVSFRCVYINHNNNAIQGFFFFFVGYALVNVRWRYRIPLLSSQASSLASEAQHENKKKPLLACLAWRERKSEREWERDGKRKGAADLFFVDHYPLFSLPPSPTVSLLFWPWITRSFVAFSRNLAPWKAVWLAFLLPFSSFPYPKFRTNKKKERRKKRIRRKEKIQFF